jgi:hypothetical protein
MTTTIYLLPEMFSPREVVLVERDEFRASIFKYPGGVCAVKLTNQSGGLVMLPFQGQQIWSAWFNDRELTMKSMFTAPRPTQNYLETYGGFLLHCGATAMGVPAGPDTHPLHGELPNAPYQDAFLELGLDEYGEYLALSGNYIHTVAFSTNYVARPKVKLHADSSLFHIELEVENLKNTEMEFMYLAHINFRPVANARLVYSAACSPQTVRVRKSIPSHVHPKPGYKEFLETLEIHPEKHHILTPDLMFDPEVVFMIDYLSDSAGWAHSLQIHPDGQADYVAHQPSQLDHGIRWICRTPDQEALGLVLPATAEPEGYHAEKSKGNIKVIPAHGKFLCQMIVGALNIDKTHTIETKINQIVQSA